ncbi:hypothetical protein CL1_0432 [Thermococcus cleftensis]|uniref:Uncharacterized protein n=1 Tax=Thermococcus cleftensis (strain DSM 27260 / KACC 17922 / CL1) TaxID=163003 RepID=I3ZSF7_THECF|nr:hypothetical protein [Thermococcus cleftensis]AFL94641.1 hypothetical protein CL1_0432 [Thermococcus cleftensis]
MKARYIGLLIALIVLAAGCISGGGTSPSPTTTTTGNLPFTQEDMEKAITSLKSYEYVMRVDSYNGTRLVAQLRTEGAIDFEKKLKAVSTLSNSTVGGGSYYLAYYYTTSKGYASYIDRNGTVTWEAACYGPGEGPNMNSTVLDGLWKVLDMENVRVIEEDGYYLIYANETGGTAIGTNVTNAYRTRVEVKLTKDLIPVEVKRTVYYEKNGAEWVDVTTIEIKNPDSATVEPPRELIDYLEEQGIDLGEFLGKC